MKLYVTHDQDGNIVAVGMPYPDAGGKFGLGETSISAEPEYTVCEVEAPGDPADFAGEEKAVKRLTEIAEQFRVDVPVRLGKLVSRKESSK